MNNVVAAETASNFWSALPTILWVGLILLGFIMFRDQCRAFCVHLTRRLRSGAAVKLGAIELGAIRVSQRPSDSRLPVPTSDAAAMARASERDKIYAEARGAMLVHRLFRSDNARQHYDILIYVIPHKDASFAQVTKVEYFLGHYWGNQVFTSSDRAHGFPLLTSAYGSFLCTAHVHFTSGEPARLSRYIDFEMGSYAPFVEDDSKKDA